MLFQYQISNDSRYIRELKNSCHGERCFLIGNGPSLVKEDLDLLINEKTFGVNRIFCMYPYTNWRPTYYMVVDGRIINTMISEHKKELGAKYIFTTSKRLNKKYEDQNAHLIAFKTAPPIRTERAVMKNVSNDVSQFFLSTGMSVINTAFELAVYMGFKEIYLLGVDHHFAVEKDMNGHKHVNQDVKPHFKEDIDQSLYPSNKEALTKAYEVCKKYAEQHGIKVINVTRGGKLEVFEKDTLEHVLNLN